MNYLGHLYFSNNDLDLMVCNLYGDYVKGLKFKHYPEKIQKGILLHRSIDNLIDTHADVLILKQSLYSDLPKVSGVAIDLFFDHLLAKYWKTYHHINLNEYLSNFFNYSSKLEICMKNDFQIFLSHLRKYRWIQHYQYEEGLEKLCFGVSKKITFENALGNAPKIFKLNEKKITNTFNTFMYDARLYFQL